MPSEIPFRPGARIRHILYGEGVVDEVRGSYDGHRDKRELVITFKDYGQRVLCWPRAKESLGEIK